MQLDFNNIHILNILIGVVVALLVALIVFLISKALKGSSRAFSFFRERARQETGLEHYKKTFEEKMLHISHPWMKEGQTLNDILVSVNFNVKGSVVKEELEFYLNHTFQKNSSPRILILGRPGSGKTVAMRMIAKTLWTIRPKAILVPILLTFSDIKGISDHEKLEEKIIQQLKLFQFEKGQRDGLTANAFIKEHLTSGKVVLLFDGYDELEKSARRAAASLLNNFLGTYSEIPAVISSRIAVYEKEPVFNQLRPNTIEMAPFTPFAVLRFISHWKFERNKSPHELFELINGKAHLSEMSSNPLMLTIITFLYSLPKYTLPDNRVEFYEQCSRALLEEWDKARNTGRANKYESHQKIAVLNRVAFEHISQTARTDELISEDVIHKITREEMERLSLKVFEYPDMKNEIVFNSGLLHSIPPTDYRFPHRTFMEFFAANYVVTEKSYEVIIALYEQDAQKWRETLLLYMGVNKNKTYSNKILEHLRRDFVDSWRAKAPPRLLVFSALTECAVPDPDKANEILGLAEEYLAAQALLPEIIEELGYIAANPRWAYSQRAKQILLDLIRRDLPDNIFHQVILALLRARDQSTSKIIFENLNRINLVEFFSTLTAADKSFVHKLFALDLSPDEKSRIIEGLKEAGNVEVLSSLLIENTDKAIKTLSAYALFRMSGLPEFFTALDQAEIGLLETELGNLIEEKLNEWGWNWSVPETRAGKQMAVLICYLSADWIIANQERVGKTGLSEVNNWFRYLTTGFLVEKGLAFHKFNLLGFIQHEIATKKGLKRHWQKKINLNNIWYKLAGYEEGAYFGVLGLGLTLLPALCGVVGVVFLLFGWTSNSFYNYIFDTFTISFTLIDYIVPGTVAYILATIQKDEDRLLFGVSGVIGALAVLFYRSPIAIRYIGPMLAFLGFGFIYLFLPFHHIGYNILYFLEFIIMFMVFYDLAQLDFALSHANELRKLYKFLEEPEAPAS